VGVRRIPIVTPRGWIAPLSDLHLPSQNDSDDSEGQPEVRLELTRAGVQQVLSLYSQEQQSSRASYEFSLNLDDIQAAIRERRRTLGLGILAGLALGAIVLLMTTPLYPVTAQVVLERQELSSRATGGAMANPGSAFVATQAEVMQSQTVVESAVESLPRPARLDPDDDAVADALEWVQATPVSGTQVIALSYLGPDPAYGVDLLNAIVGSYRDVLRHNEQASQQQKVLAKKAEVEVLLAEADDVQKKVDALRADNRLLGSAAEAAEAQAEVLRENTDQLSAIRNDRIALENRLATGGEQLAILDPATRSLQEQLWQAEAELSRVQLTLQPRHPAVEAARQEVEVLRKQLRESSKATPEALRRDIEAARGLEQQLAATFEREQERMAEIERYRREEEALLVELDRIRELTDARRSELLDQRLLARLAESGEVGVAARMIEVPAMPIAAIWPKPLLVLGGGAILGLIGGFGMALLSLRQSRAQWVAGSQTAAGKANFA
jgi:uncharacterized protein involved in exopolysaccharide biosynthesis